VILNRTNTVLAVLLLFVAAIALAIQPDHSRPNFEFLPEMKHSPASKAYAANPHFRNGRTLQAPVAGTIARGDLPLYFAATKEDAVRASEELQNPYAKKEQPSIETTSDDAGTPIAAATGKAATSDPEAQFRQRLQASVQRGGDVYQVLCISCHGPQGAGDGPVAKRGFPPPPPLTTGKSAQMKDGQLFHILTYGQGSMAPMAAQLARERRWDVINYVRGMQRAAAEKLKQASAPTATPTTEPAKPQPTDIKEGNQ